MRMCCGLAEPLPLIRFIIFVIPFEPDNLAVAFIGENVRGNAIEKPAIVAGDENATRELAQRFLQRPQCVDI